MLDYLSILKMHYLQELSFREIGVVVKPPSEDLSQDLRNQN